MSIRRLLATWYEMKVMAMRYKDDIRAGIWLSSKQYNSTMDINIDASEKSSYPQEVNDPATGRTPLPRLLFTVYETDKLPPDGMNPPGGTPLDQPIRRGDYGQFQFGQRQSFRVVTAPYVPSWLD